MSLDKVELNPLYSATNKLILYPIIVISMVGIWKFGDTRAFKFASVFLVSLFAFAFLWNVGAAYADSALVNRVDATHQASGLSASGKMSQVFPTSIQGAVVSKFAMNIGCGAGTFNVSYGIAKATTSITSVLSINKTTITDTTPSTIALETYNFTIQPTVLLSPLVAGEKYIAFINTTETSCGGITRLMGGGEFDTPGEGSGGLGTLTSTYVGTSITTTAPTMSYAVYGDAASIFNQTATSTCNALNGNSCSSTTSSVSFPSDCSANSFLAKMNHQVSLLNGSTNASQFATATSEYILPASNQFSNITIINWTNQNSLSVNLTFSKSNYNAGESVQSRCSLNMNNNTATSGTSTCSLAISCIEIAPSVPSQTPTNVIESPFTPITEGNASDLAFQIFQLFLSPFMIATLIMFTIAVIVARELKDTGSASSIFLGMCLIFALAYTVIGIYPLFIGIIIILAICVVLSKMVIGFVKGG